MGSPVILGIFGSFRVFFFIRQEICAIYHLFM
jgi:hypothetical protein